MSHVSTLFDEKRALLSWQGERTSVHLQQESEHAQNMFSKCCMTECLNRSDTMKAGIRRLFAVGAILVPTVLASVVHGVDTDTDTDYGPYSFREINRVFPPLVFESVNAPDEIRSEKTHTALPKQRAIRLFYADLRMRKSFSIFEPFQEDLYKEKNLPEGISRAEASFLFGEGALDAVGLSLHHETLASESDASYDEVYGRPDWQFTGTESQHHYRFSATLEANLRAYLDELKKKGFECKASIPNDEAFGIARTCTKKATVSDKPVFYSAQVFLSRNRNLASIEREVFSSLEQESISGIQENREGKPNRKK
jgi:hypothetical protein